LYDELGSALFEAITVLPEYGLTRADTRVLKQLSPELAGLTSIVVELGSGTGTKTRIVLEALSADSSPLYLPIDQSASALARCADELGPNIRVQSIHAPYLEGLQIASARRRSGEPLLTLFLGSTIGNFAPEDRIGFLSSVREKLQRGDSLLIGFDLVKDREVILNAYDDPAGVTAAFNKNVLGRINRELGANFDLRQFKHEARWDESNRRVEMHLRSEKQQVVEIPGARCRVEFKEGETIWTESSHKFLPDEPALIGAQCGFVQQSIWMDREWPFAEALWVAE
jgi:dimethylhistidine N-methyltransferase